MNADWPDDLPTADVLTLIHGLVGHRVIYEENREFLAVDIRDVTSSGDHDIQLRVSLHNLNLLGFCATFPPDFTVGGRIDEVSVGTGVVGAYMGIWSMIIDPIAVKRVIRKAVCVHTPTELLKVCREVTRRKYIVAY
jgi:hypothetical protein